MARKDGGESEGIVLYPSRSPSLGWKPTPLAPLVRGVKAMRPRRVFSTAPHRSRLTLKWGVIPFLHRRVKPSRLGSQFLAPRGC